MPPKPRKKQPARTDRPPLYDPKVHTDPGLEVFVGLYCTCGGLWRQRDPVSYVAPRVLEFLARHHGRNHAPASKPQCIQARETRRQAMYAAQGQGDRWRAREYPHVDTADTEVKPWPVFPAPELPTAAVPAVPRRMLEG